MATRALVGIDLGAARGCSRIGLLLGERQHVFGNVVDLGIGHQLVEAKPRHLRSARILLVGADAEANGLVDVGDGPAP